MTFEDPLSDPHPAPMTDMPLDLTAFHRMHRPTYIRWSRRYLGNLSDAEEAVDETFVYLAGMWPTVLSMANPAAYAWKVMRNRTIDYARLRNRRSEQYESDLFDTIGMLTATDPIAALEEGMALTQAVGLLSSREKDVFDLRHREGMTTAEVAAQLGITEAGVRSIDRYARRKLRQIISTWEQKGEPQL